MKSILPIALSLLISPSFAGVTQYYASPTGGAYGAGTVYQVDGSQQTVIYDFCSAPSCADGSTPLSNLLLMPDGSLIGATSAGGYGQAPGGVIFRLTQSDDGSWSERVLVSICPYWHECGRFGYPSGSVSFVPPNFIEGVNQTGDGKKGVRWRFKLVADGGIWKPLQYWAEK